MSSRFVGAGLLFALLAISKLDADDRPQPGAVEQHGGPVSQDVKLPPLELTNAQREKMKDLVVVVDATTRKIVDVFSETQPLT